MDDPEMGAMSVIAQALEPLDRDACARILKWLEDRYLEQPKRKLGELAWHGIDEQVKAYRKYAADLGVDDRQLAHALAHVRGVKRLAPIGTDRDPVGTAGAAKARAEGGS